jgi:hypothetical protein
LNGKAYQLALQKAILKSLIVSLVLVLFFEQSYMVTVVLGDFRWQQTVKTIETNRQHLT